MKYFFIKFFLLVLILGCNAKEVNPDNNIITHVAGAEWVPSLEWHHVDLVALSPDGKRKAIITASYDSKKIFKQLSIKMNNRIVEIPKELFVYFPKPSLRNMYLS